MWDVILYGGVVVAVLIGLIVSCRCIDWMVEANECHVLFRPPRTALIGLYMLAALMWGIGIFVIVVAVQDAPKHPALAPAEYFAAILDFFITASIGNVCLWAGAPTELAIDLERRTFRHTRRFLWMTKETRGTMDEMSGVYGSPSGSVILVFRRQRPLYPLGLYGKKSGEVAARFAAVLGLPVVPSPWR